MECDKWYSVKYENVEKIKELFVLMIENHDIELTFNREYTKLKKTLWVKNQPVL